MKTTSREEEAGNEVCPKAFFSYHRNISYLLLPSTSVSLLLHSRTNHKYKVQTRA